MRTQRGLERLVFFTDAVVAISVTLLIVPLVDSATQSAAVTPTPGQFLQDNTSALIAFGISFAVIARLWVAHHSVMEQAVAYSPALRTANLAWAFTIAFLPLPTVLASEYRTDRVSLGLYIGTMLLSSVALLAIGLTLRRDASLRHPGTSYDDQSLSGGLATTLLFASALVLGLVVPAVGYLALLLLFLSGPLENLLYRRITAS